VTLAGGPRVHGLIDPGNLTMALGELLANAIRFTPAGADITVSWQAAQGAVEVHVEDEGPGVDAGLSERLTRPFFSTSTQGTGLGLNIVSKICRLAGGELSWQNRPERGCRFTLRLPGG
jgi:signal transduction histidine kinase